MNILKCYWISNEAGMSHLFSPETKLPVGFITVCCTQNQSKAFIFDKLAGSVNGK